MSCIEHKCETPGAKPPREQCSYYEPISETSEARASGVVSTIEPNSETTEAKVVEPRCESVASDEILDAVEKILEEGMTDKQKRDEAERISAHMSLPWRPKKPPVKNLFVDPSTLPVGSFAFGTGNRTAGFPRLSGGM